MSKPTIGQSHTVIQTLTTNVNWEVLDHIILQKIVDDPTEAGRQFTKFLKNGGKVVVDSPKIINIDRSEPFDPKTFIGEGWSIEEQDQRSVNLTSIDLTEVIFDSTLEKGEKMISSEERLKRLKDKRNFIRLDAKIFKTILENEHLIPVKWAEKIKGNITYIFFTGTILRGPDGKLYVYYLYLDYGLLNHGMGAINDLPLFNINTPDALLFNVESER